LEEGCKHIRWGEGVYLPSLKCWIRHCYGCGVAQYTKQTDLSGGPDFCKGVYELYDLMNKEREELVIEVGDTWVRGLGGKEVFYGISMPIEMLLSDIQGRMIVLTTKTEHYGFEVQGHIIRVERFGVFAKEERVFQGEPIGLVIEEYAIR
jgi:hypothetical protein